MMKRNTLKTCMFLIGIYFASGQAYAQNSIQQQLQNIQSSIEQDKAAVQKPPQPSTQPVLEQPSMQGFIGTAHAQPVAQAQQGPIQIDPTAAPQSPVARPVQATAPTTAQGTTPPVVVDPNADLRDEAFARMTATKLPLSPTQIEMLRNLYDATQRASAVFPGTPPKPISTSVIVDLSPGKTPPIIRLHAGFVTSLVFVDSTGAPWPIDSYSLGNPSAFNIQWDKKSNILLVQAITSHRVANLAVILKELNTPVMINLTPGQAAMDTRVDLRIPKRGPSAKTDAMSGSSGLPGTESPLLVDLLDGIPPPGARALKTTGCDNCAWLLDDKLYLRMPYTLLSPGWISTLSSADGTNVYELQPTPLVLATYNGKTIKLRIEGF